MAILLESELRIAVAQQQKFMKSESNLFVAKGADKELNYWKSVTITFGNHVKNQFMIPFIQNQKVIRK
jgi:hypothetical protein